MISVRLAPPHRLAVVGSSDYLRRRQRPERIDDLRQHACLRMRRSNGSIAPWSFVNGNEAVEVIVSGPFIANDMPTMLGAAIEGLGLAQVPAPIAADAVKAVETRARVGTVCAAGAGCVPLLSQPPSNDAETASLRRSREAARRLRQTKPDPR
jgi:DNA-binding transcriptional LysR family regulator